MEDIIPRGVDKLLFVLAPAIATIPAFISFAIIPFGPIVSIFDHHTPLQLTDLPVAVLLVLAMSSMAVYGIVLAGWASTSPYSLLGGLRSSAQVISYEIAMGLSFVPVFLYAGSLSTSNIVEAQAHGSEFHLGGVILHYPSWFAILLLPSFVIYVITMVGETNRLPFDLPEGEGELVGGFHTEYCSLKFALFYLAEYINMVTVSALAVTLFLGGWRAPWPISVWSGREHRLVADPVVARQDRPVHVPASSGCAARCPRIRYDQLMKLGWKVLIPGALAWTLMIATHPGVAPAGRQPRGLHRGRRHRRDPDGAGLGLGRSLGPAAGRPGRRRGRGGGRGRAAETRARSDASTGGTFPVPAAGPAALPRHRGHPGRRRRPGCAGQRRGSHRRRHREGGSSSA